MGGLASVVSPGKQVKQAETAENSENYAEKNVWVEGIMSRLCRLGVLPKLGLNELWWRIHKEGEKGWGVVCSYAAQ